MNITLEYLSKEQFENLKSLVLFEDKQSNRRFAKLTNGRVAFRFGWNSDLIDPEIIHLTSDNYGIGIDLNYCIVDFDEAEVKKIMDFDSFFLSSILKGCFLYLGTEIEIFKIDIDQLEVVQSYFLPDTFDVFVDEGNGLFAKCLNGSVVKIDSY